MPQKMRFFFRKNQRLHKDYDVSPLFKEGEGIFCFPIKLVFRLIPMPSGDTTPCKVVVIVAKRYLKKAFMRNMVRRRMREAYRLNINQVNPPIGYQVHIAIVYVAHQVLEYAPIEKSIKTMVRELNHKVNQLQPKPTKNL